MKSAELPVEGVLSKLQRGFPREVGGSAAPGPRPCEFLQKTPPRIGADVRRISTVDRDSG